MTLLLKVPYSYFILLSVEADDVKRLASTLSTLGNEKTKAQKVSIK